MDTRTTHPNLATKGERIRDWAEAAPDPGWRAEDGKILWTLRYWNRDGEELSASGATYHPLSPPPSLFP